MEKEMLINELRKEFRAHQTSFRPRDICSYSEGFNDALDLAIQKVREFLK